MTQHRLNGGTPSLLQLDRLRDVLRCLCRPAEQVEHKGAIASCSGVLRCLIHGSITAIKDCLQLIFPEGLKTALCCGVVLS